MHFIPCTPRYLPAELQIASAATAVAVNPANRPLVEGLAIAGLAMRPEHLAVLTGKYWGSKGVKLTVGFLDGAAADLRNRILGHMNAWGEFSNVSFAWTSTDPQVRISRAGQGYWSYLGTDLLHIAKNQPTMNLEGFTMKTPESEVVAVVRHETGHAIGCPHEHMRRELVGRIDPAKAIAYFRQNQGWNAAMVQQQVLTPLEESSILGTSAADQTSIMCYRLPGSITRDGQPIAGGDDFSAADKAFAARIYPKAITVPPPPAGGSRLTFYFPPGQWPDGAEFDLTPRNT